VSAHARAWRRWSAVRAAVLIALFAATAAAQRADSIVILISIDGWRWDYLDRFKPPTIAALADAGVRAEALLPVFPSKTFPNHYSIVTGLYPERHGILSNSMVDPALPGRFTLSMENRHVQADTRWWGGEPLWVTAERQGVVSATMFWPGSDAEIAGRRPTYWEPYEHELAREARVDQLLEWLRRPPPLQPRFLTLYFSDVDSAGHEHGPEAPETRRIALEIDRMIGRLIEGLTELGLARRTNLMLVSDHGMAPLARERTIVLDDYVDVATVDIVDSTPVLGANPRTGSADALYLALKGRHPAMQVYRRDDLPARFRLTGHPRLPAVVAIADDGWHVTTRQALERRGHIPGGDHGFDPQATSMHGLFVASGPAFRSGLVAPAFENIHIYELICHILGLSPASNDGDLAVTRSFLR
jgi:predicted AlkP superfamily pyrophosphatase or phosphodiesterase